MLIAKFNTLFVHVPKAAGQSIERYFLGKLGKNWDQREEYLLKQNQDPQKGPPRIAHLYAREYYELGYINREYFDSLIKFSVVREPYSRLMSEYLYRMINISFRDFVFHLDDFTDDYKNGDDLRRHLEPQHKFTHAADAERLVNHIIKMEDLDREFHFIQNLIGISPEPLPRFNQANRKLTLSRGKIRSFIFNKIFNRPAELGKQCLEDNVMSRAYDYYNLDYKLLGYSKNDLDSSARKMAASIAPIPNTKAIVS